MVTPNGWELRPIGDFLEFKNGLNKGKEYFGYGTPIINYMDVYHHRGLHASDIQGRVSLDSDEIRRFAVRKGDVFFTRTSETPEEVGISSVLLDELPEGVFSGFVLRGRPKSSELSLDYCKYCFSTRAVREAIVKSCTYTTRALTNGGVLSQIEVLIPSTNEQGRISDALDEVELLIAVMEATVAKKRNMREGMAQSLLTGTIRLPGYDSDWERVELQQALSFCTAMIPTENITISDYVGTENMLKDRGGITANRKPLSYARVREYLSGDILVSNIRPYLKKIWFATHDGGCSNDVLVLRSIDTNRYDPVYCFLLLSRNDYFSYATNNSSGTKMPRGDKDAIKRYLFRMPTDVNEQRAIASVLITMDQEITDLESKLRKYEQIRQGMMRELLTGHIRLVQE